MNFTPGAKNDLLIQPGKKVVEAYFSGQNLVRCCLGAVGNTRY